MTPINPIETPLNNSDLPLKYRGIDDGGADLLYKNIELNNFFIIRNVFLYKFITYLLG